MVDASESIAASVATQKISKPLRCTATHCSGIHARVARAIWPKKTAENWASAAGRKVRMAGYWLAGTHPVDDAGKLALIRELQ